MTALVPDCNDKCGYSYDVIQGMCVFIIYIYIYIYIDR